MLYLVRHEDTPFNTENKFRGSANPSLSQKGKHAALGLRYRLDGKFDRIVCDSYARTCETARIIADGKPIETDEGLRPWDIGDFSGEEKTEARLKELDTKYVKHPERSVPGGESRSVFLQRWKKSYKGYLRDAKGDDGILLVTHGSNIAAVLGNFGPAESYEDNIAKPGTILVVGEDGVPKFLEAKLKKQYGAKSAVPYKIMNSIGAMKGNKETAKGRAMQAKHTMKLSKLARA